VVQKQIADTQLYKLLKLMPKGSILHIHSDSMGDYSFLLKLATTYRTPDHQKQFYVNQDTTGDPHEYFKLIEINEPPLESYIPLSEVLINQDLWTTSLGNITLTVDKLQKGIDMWTFWTHICSSGHITFN